MSHLLRLLFGITAGVTVFSARPAVAQPVARPAAAARPRLPPVVWRASGAPSTVGDPGRHATRRRPGRATYVVGGALLGGAAMAAGLAIALSSGEECTCAPFVFAPAVGGGLVVGAGAGYVVHRIRFR